MTLTNDQRELLIQAKVAGISDAMESLGYRRTVIVGFRCSVPSKTVVGTAFTIRQVPKHYPATHDERLCRHGEVSRGLAESGDFVVLDAGGRTDVAGWGGHHSQRCHSRNVSGVLVNGSVRDAAEIRDMEFPAFYLGTSPISSKWDQQTSEIGGSVTVAGVHIKAGDILAGDEDGLILVSSDQLLSVLNKILSKESSEK